METKEKEDLLSRINSEYEIMKKENDELEEKLEQEKDEQQQVEQEELPKAKSNFSEKTIRVSVLNHLDPEDLEQIKKDKENQEKEQNENQETSKLTYLKKEQNKDQDLYEREYDYSDLEGEDDEEEVEQEEYRQTYPFLNPKYNPDSQSRKKLNENQEEYEKGITQSYEYDDHTNPFINDQSAPNVDLDLQVVTSFEKQVLDKELQREPQTEETVVIEEQEEQQEQPVEENPSSPSNSDSISTDPNSNPEEVEEVETSTVETSSVDPKDEIEIESTQRFDGNSLLEHISNIEKRNKIIKRENLMQKMVKDNIGKYDNAIADYDLKFGMRITNQTPQVEEKVESVEAVVEENPQGVSSKVVEDKSMPTPKVDTQSEVKQSTVYGTATVPEFDTFDKDFKYSLEEKIAVKEALNPKTLEKLNYLLNSFENNILMQEKSDVELSLIYRQINAPTQILSTLYNLATGYKISKLESLDVKKGTKRSKADNIAYIPFEKEKFLEKFSKPNENGRYDITDITIGQTIPIVTDSFEYSKYKDLLILQINIENILAFVTNNDFQQAKKAILLPPFELEMSIYDIQKLADKAPNTSKMFAIAHLKNDKEDNVEKIYRFLKEAIAQKTFKLDKDTQEIENLKDKLLKNAIEMDIAIKRYYKFVLKKQEFEQNIALIDSSLEMLDEKQTKEALETKQKLQENINELNMLIDDIQKNVSEYKKEYKVAFLNIENNVNKILQEQYIEENIGVQKEQQQEQREIERLLRINKNRALNMVDETNHLINKQKQYANIGAITYSKYSSLVDGFEIKSMAEKLAQILTDMHKDYQEYYFLKMSKKPYSLEYENKLQKIYDVSEKVSIFLNYIYNPKNTKKVPGIDRFNELELLEENELKKCIEKSADELIGNANLLIIDDQIDTIEFKNVAAKLFDLISGKWKSEKYKINVLEQLAEDIERKIAQTYNIDRNYKIHDILAKIMLFKVENKDTFNDDEQFTNTMDKLGNIELAIGQNFVISEPKILAKIKELESSNFLTVTDEDEQEKSTEELKADAQVADIRRKYGYDQRSLDQNENANGMYVDTTASEIKQIIEYIKVSL